MDDAVRALQFKKKVRLWGREEGDSGKLPAESPAEDFRDHIRYLGTYEFAEKVRTHEQVPR